MVELSAKVKIIHIITALFLKISNTVQVMNHSYQNIYLIGDAKFLCFEFLVTRTVSRIHDVIPALKNTRDQIRIIITQK